MSGYVIEIIEEYEDIEDIFKSDENGKNEIRKKQCGDVQNNRNLILTLKFSDPITIVASIDFYHVVHNDLKSQSGIIISFVSGTLCA